MILSCRAILFDLDGVLVDSTPAVARVWSRWAREQGLDADLVVATAHGRRSLETIRTVAPHLNAQQENRRVEALEIAERDGIKALPGAAEILRALPPEKFAVVTSATRALAAARLSYAGLPAIPHMICADDVVSGKPFPEPYLKGAALLGVAPADCLVFEDTPTGIESARGAGMQVIALLTTYPQDELQAATAIAQSLAVVTVTSHGEGLQLRVKD